MFSNTLESTLCWALPLMCLLVDVSTAPYGGIEPAAPRWTRPCEGKHNLTSNHNHTAFQTSAIIGNKTRELSSETYNLMKRYITERFGDPLFPKQLDGFSLTGMPSVPAVPPDERYREKLNETFEATHEQYSRVAVFMEQAYIDERTYEYKQGYSNNIKNSLEKIYSILCEVRLIVMSQEFSELRLVAIGEDIMPRSHRDLLDAATRHNRDYIVLRDFHKILHYTALLYSDIKRN